MLVKPAEGRSPRDPRTMMRIPPEGIEVDEHDPSFAALRLHGDLVEYDPPPPASAVAGMAEDPPPETGPQQDGEH